MQREQRVRLVLKALRVQLQPLLLGRRVLLATLELQALLTAAVRALLSLILFCVMAPLALLVQLAPLVHRAQLALKALRETLGQRDLLALRVPQALRVLRAPRALRAPMALTAQQQRSLLEQLVLLPTRVLRRLQTAVVLVLRRLTLCCVTGRLARRVRRALQVLKDRKAILALRELRVRKERLALQGLRVRLAPQALMERTVLMVQLQRLQLALPRLSQTLERRLLPTVVRPVRLRSTLF